MATSMDGDPLHTQLLLSGSEERTKEFIKLRAENDDLFTWMKHSAAAGWKTILDKMGLQEKVEPQRAKKKWDNLKKKKVQRLQISSNWRGSQREAQGCYLVLVCPHG
ncbi:uncharacterized protein AB9X84_014108 [Acanthopagrus schlegelii]